MKFNRQTNEKQRILELIKKANENKEYELEALIYHQPIQKLVKYDHFISCLKRVKNQKEFKASPAIEIINITFRQDSKFKYLRITISGKETIKFFCSHGRLKDLGSNVKYYHKESISSEGGKPMRVDMDDYYIRFNLKEEREILDNDPLIKELMDNWFEVPKYFRYKKIFSFESSNGLFRSDFAIVKDSKSEIREMTVSEVRRFGYDDLVVKPEEVKNFKEWWNRIKNQSKMIVKVADQPVYYQSFQKSGTLEAKPYYEIEVEYLGNQKSQKTINDENILIQFIEIIGVHLQAIQKSYFIVGRGEVAKLRNDMMSLTGNRGKNLFKAPQPYTLEAGHLQQFTNRQYLEDTNYTIRKNFLVTEKADGERELLYINPLGEFYFIGRLSEVRKLGIKMVELANTLIDGEYLENQNLYMIFDVYFFQNKPIWKEVFNPRYEIIKKITDYIKSNMDIDIDIKDKHKKDKSKSKQPLNIAGSDKIEIKKTLLVGRKIFYSGDTIFNTNPNNLDKSNNDTLIFDACKKILNQVSVNQGGLLEIGHQFGYNVDGLIFVPSNLYVGQDDKRHEVKNFFDASEWQRTYKWKPPVMNSIDFEMEVYRPPQAGIKGNSGISEEYYNGVLFRRVILKVDYQSYFHDRYNAQRAINEDLADFNGLKPFMPNYPFVGELDYNGNLIEESHIAWVRVDGNGNMITLEGHVVNDGDVVEFSYDVKTDNPEYRWKALRHRPNKKANGFHTALNVWRSIHKPLTTKMIVGEEAIPPADVYYQSKVDRDELYLKEMNKFHNFVKSRLFEHLGKEKKRPSILDLACGKFGDLYKWFNLKPRFVLGVDIAQDNINNFENGAGARALLAQENNEQFKKMNSNLMMVWGDCGLPLNTAEAGLDDLNKYYLNILYGNSDVGDYSKLGKLSGKALQKFDLVTCHFAIHYFFENYARLTGFLDNVYQNLKMNGYFIGTCLDGKSVNKLFNKADKKVIGQFQDKEETKLIWRIKKNYEIDNDMEDNESSLGLSIKVDVESINTTSNEYLVNFDYLVKLMNEYGLELVDSKLFHEVPNSMLEEFYADPKNKEIGKILRQKTKSLEYSTLHRWFIFVKKGISDNDLPLTKLEEEEITSVEYKPREKPREKQEYKEKQKGGFEEYKDEEAVSDMNSQELDIQELNLDDIKIIQ